jgi:hypothetical protein
VLVKGCPIDAIHTFQVRTLKSLGYRTRVALGNKSHQRADFRTDYRVDISVYTNGKGRTRFIENAGTLPANGRLAIDCAPYDTGAHDSMLVVHLVPTRHAGPTADVSREELMFLAGIQDHYVEYYRDDGCSAGVLYSTGPFNHPKVAPKSTTLIQAPKFYVSSAVDSMLSVSNASADPTYERVAQLRLTLVGDGIKHTWREEVPAFTPVSISVRDRVRQLGKQLSEAPVFVCLYAVCENATVVPLTIMRDDDTGAIGIEHSLPPDYYSETMKGPTRMKAMERLTNSPVFEGAR